MKMQSDFSWIVPIEVMLGSLTHAEVQLCSISNVPEKLREVNEDAYTPKHISIGPLHRGTTRHLQITEEPKWHYMRELLVRQGDIPEQNRRSEIRLRECSCAIFKLDKVICASYGGSNNNIVEKTDRQEIAKIMIVDGCFLLELLIRLGDCMLNQTTVSFNNDSILKTNEKMLSVLNDITMLENQIPFIVLKKLYRKVFPDSSEIKDDYRVANIVRKAFGYPSKNSSGGAHILHLMHLSTVEQNHQHEGKQAKVELLCCATELRASGVMIGAKLNSTNKKQYNLVDMFDFDIKFEAEKLDIPPLYIKETTEVKWRNLIAWEQSKIWIRCKYTSYALFFNGLICCEHDIELLQKKGVIVNALNKSNEDLLILFRTIAKGAEQMDSSYSEICEGLNVFYEKRMKATKVLRKLPIHAWHQCRRIFEIFVYYGRNWYNVLIRDHIPTVWKFIGINCRSCFAPGSHHHANILLIPHCLICFLINLLYWNIGVFIKMFHLIIFDSKSKNWKKCRIVFIGLLLLPPWSVLVWSLVFLVMTYCVFLASVFFVQISYFYILSNLVNSEDSNSVSC